MMNVVKIRRLFCLAVIFIFLASTTFLFMPLIVESGPNERILSIVLGSVFWTTSVLSYVLLIMANRERKYQKKHKSGGNPKDLPGIISFFSNVPAAISDVIMFISLVMVIVSYFTEWKYEYISYVLLFLFYLSLNLHCMFNGRIYKSTK